MFGSYDVQGTIVCLMSMRKLFRWDSFARVSFNPLLRVCADDANQKDYKSCLNDLHGCSVIKILVSNECGKIFLLFIRNDNNESDLFELSASRQNC